MDTRRPRYFVIPGMVIVPNSYLLCDKHKNLSYFFDDVYDENSKRKEIDHEAVMRRSKNEKTIAQWRKDQEALNNLQEKANEKFWNGFDACFQMVINSLDNYESNDLATMNCWDLIEKIKEDLTEEQELYKKDG